jgi:hypothetical protein
MSLVATPEETKVLAAVEAGLAAGDDVFGDDDDDTDTGDAGTGDDAGGADDAAATGADTDLTEEALTDVLDEPATGDQPAHQFTAEVAADYKEQRAALTTEKAQALKKLMDGEIDAEEYAAVETRVSESISDLDSARIRAETLIEANTQNVAAYQQKAIQKLIAATKTEVDYAADPKAQKQFDTALNTILSDPDNANLEYTELLTQAHRVVAAVRGLHIANAPAATPGAPATRRPNVTAPVTLRNIPAAATPNANGDINDQMGRLKGQDFEAAFDKLSPAQQRAMLDD